MMLLSISCSVTGGETASWTRATERPFACGSHLRCPKRARRVGPASATSPPQRCARTHACHCSDAACQIQRAKKRLRSHSDGSSEPTEGGAGRRTELGCLL